MREVRIGLRLLLGSFWDNVVSPRDSARGDKHGVKRPFLTRLQWWESGRDEYGTLIDWDALDHNNNRLHQRMQLLSNHAQKFGLAFRTMNSGASHPLSEAVTNLCTSLNLCAYLVDRARVSSLGEGAHYACILCFFGM